MQRTERSCRLGLNAGSNTPRAVLREVARAGLRLSLCCAVLLAGSAWMSAATQEQTTDPGPGRADALLAERRARLARVQPAGKSKVAGFLATAETEGFDQLVSFQLRDFRLGFGKISPISNFTPAIRYQRLRLGESQLSFEASGAYSVRNYQAYDLKIGVFDEPVPPDFLGDGFLGAPFDFDQRSQQPIEGFLYGDVRYRNFPREVFYGLGMDSEESNRTDYRHEVTSLDVVGGYQFARWIGVQARAGLLGTNVGAGTVDSRPDTGDVFDDITAPGVEHQPDFFHFDSGLYLTWAADPNDPAASLGVRFARFDEQGGNRFQFNRFSVDTRGYLPLGSRQRTIAVRYYVSLDYADDGSEVPFYMMKSLGGQDTLRGYRDYRFRDQNLLYLSGEYRWEATTGIELAMFYDTGKVFNDRSGFKFDGLKHSFGAGIRAKSLRRVSFRMDVGRSGDGNTLLFFAFGPSF